MTITWTPRDVPWDRAWATELAADPTRYAIYGDWLDKEGRATWEREEAPLPWKQWLYTENGRSDPRMTHAVIGSRTRCGRAVPESATDVRPPRRDRWERGCGYCYTCWCFVRDERITIDRSALPVHCQPPHLMRLTAKLIEFADERRHGEEACKCCGGAGRRIIDSGPYGYDVIHGRCPDCNGTKKRPTFALLFDREGACPICSDDDLPAPDDAVPCEGTGKVTIPGHLRQLADWLTECGDPRGAAVGAICIKSDPTDRSGYPFEVHPYDETREVTIVPPRSSGNVFATYADAGREAIARVMKMLTAECPRKSVAMGEARPIPAGLGYCPDCLGLDWLATGAAGKE